MDNVKLELSAQYYIAVAAVWLLGAILIIAHFFGLDPDQSLPFIDLIMENPRDYPRVVAALLISFVVYLFVGWKQSPRKSRKSYWSQAHAGLTTLFACVSLWLSYPLIAANTGFAGVSPGWFLGFLVIGLLLGRCISDLVFFSLMIRTSMEAQVFHLPRVPVSTRILYRIWFPISLLLLVAFYILRHYSPDIIKEFGLGYTFAFVPFLFLIGGEFAPLCLSQDENGNRIPLTKRIARFKEAHDSIDYSFFLIDCGRKVAEEIDIDLNASPQAIQEAMQEAYSVESRTGSFRGELKEDIELEFYSKDGDPENKTPENQGVRIKKKKGKKDLLRMLINFDDPEMESQEMEIPIGLLETHAEEYLSTHTDDSDLDANKFISYALNKTVIQIWAEEAGPLLHRAVQAGLEDQVKELLKQDINVNERAEAGWTSLLYASAQGYPRIVQLLLDAGANPDIGNIHGITPLMYGARYGNIDVCRILLENGANTDLQDMYGITALMVATSLGHADVVDMLLDIGVNTAIKNRDDMTALDIAHNCNQGKIAKSLRIANRM